MPVIETAPESTIMPRVGEPADPQQDSLVEDRGSKPGGSFLRSIASTAKRLHTSYEKRIEQGLGAHTDALKNAPDILQNVWTAGLKRHNDALRKAANTTLAEAADSVTSADLSLSALSETLRQGVENRKVAAKAAVTKVVNDFEDIALSVVEEVRAESKVGIAAVRSSQAYRKALKNAQNLLDDGVSSNQELTASQRELLSCRGEQDLGQIKDTIRQRYEKLLTDNANPETFSRKEIRARLERMLNDGPEAVATLVQAISSAKSEVEHHNSRADVASVYELSKSEPVLNVHSTVVEAPVTGGTGQLDSNRVNELVEKNQSIALQPKDASEQLPRAKETPLLAPVTAQTTPTARLTVHAGGLYQADMEATLRESMVTRSPESHQGLGEVTFVAHDGGAEQEHPVLEAKDIAPQLAVVTDNDRIAAIIRTQNVTTLRKLATAVSKVEGLAIEGRSKMTKATLITRITGDSDILAYVVKNQEKLLNLEVARQNAAASKKDGSKTMTIK